VYSRGTDETYWHVVPIRSRDTHPAQLGSHAPEEPLLGGFLWHITTPMMAGHLEDETRYGEPTARRKTYVI
jgi:hypothetical protein